MKYHNVVHLNHIITTVESQITYIDTKLMLLPELINYIINSLSCEENNILLKIVVGMTCKKFFNLYNPKVLFKKHHRNICKIAILHDNLYVLKCAIKRHKHCSNYVMGLGRPTKYVCSCTENLCLYAVESGNIELLKWLHHKGYLVNTSTFSIAAFTGNIIMLE